MWVSFSVDQAWGRRRLWVFGKSHFNGAIASLACCFHQTVPLPSSHIPQNGFGIRLVHIPQNITAKRMTQIPAAVL